MTMVNDSFSPKDGFIVFSRQKLLAGDPEIVIKLYQPLIGAASFSLYMLLRTFVAQRVSLSERRMHTTLLELLDMGANTLYEARCKLEAIGLLRTYEQEDELGKVVLYELQAPQLPRAFFEDDLLRTLLLETVGEQQFKALQHYFFNPLFEHPQAVETTKHFLEVFNIQPRTLQQKTRLASLFESSATKKPEMSWKETGLDRTFVVALLEHSFIDTKQVLEHEKKLLVAHVVYGLDELTLVNLLEQAANVATNKVDFALFEKLVQQQKPQGALTKQVNQPQAEAVTSQDVPQLRQEDQGLLDACRAYAPADFLRVLKKEKGSFATASELHTLEWVGQKKLFHPAVINVLIHYMMIDREMALLNRNFFEAVISDWSQKKIATPEEAMQQVRSFNSLKKQQKTPTSKTRPRRRTQVIQKEKLPDWAKDGAQLTPQSKFSEADRQKLKARLSKFKKKQ